MNSKGLLRAEMLARRRLLDDAEKVSNSSQIQRSFLGLDAYSRAAKIAVYLPVNGEVATEAVIEQALTDGKEVYLPVVEGEHIHLRRFFPNAPLVPGKFGVPGPSAGALLADLRAVDLFVVPGVVFDHSGHRIGYGKGYFDRLLHGRSDAALLVGFCYDFQLVKEITTELHDVKMDLVITERRMITAF